MTIIETLKWASEKLKHESKDPSDSSILDAQILLAAVLKTPTSKLFLNFNNQLKDEDLEKFRQFIKRRLNREPIAYIVGEKEFYKRKFFVNPHTLIPRPATETLVEAAIKIAKQDKKQILFTDIGTGSGAIAITLAAETKLPVIAVDIDPTTLAVARKNAVDNQVEDLIDLRLGSLLAPLVKIFETLKKTNETPFDHLIVCANLPYLATEQWKKTAPDVYLFEPKLALEAGADGLDLYWQLLRDLKKNRELFPFQLSLLIEIGPDQKEKTAAIIKRNFPDFKIIVLKDLDGFERVVVATDK
ncbi:MAG: Release factor glutamine methyltransferase [Candidatus Uhrbacteria bacterium GW2011_GWF2_44_350]|uniref:Release factor glutamine methyltransferase n=1 Tax=Candidatus Uhrbacteria bacterium GW2011_GWF2_44_350 TaxID=1619000 RepID=A0A0G1JF15_9BACT|nr:MAG: Release factor glutamine methyltransferase [Candidatus Uhrbacteria bacterium GW2011_GWF2_44_350]HBR80387.1 peptide chain release factor N(5)-glutamine methyltransferase [Candidatus Uhrbacteria bacterium]HCU31897.1 peptide chain release factor N(5)-glutamine methyltransferase [Candidatus Uhrbacteria bacterium]